MKTKNGISLFALVAFIAFVITAILEFNSLAIIIQHDIDLTISLAAMNILVFIALLLLGIRLYMHAWAVDETFLISRIMDSVDKKPKHYLESSIRIIWLTLTLFLPTVCSNDGFNILNFHISWSFYLFTIFFLLCFWDLILKKDIIEEAKNNQPEEQKKEIEINLKKYLFSYDFLLLLASFVNLIIWDVDLHQFSESITNWRIPLFFLVITIIPILCGIQVFIFFKEIKNCKIEFIFTRS